MATHQDLVFDLQHSPESTRPNYEHRVVESSSALAICDAGPPPVQREHLGSYLREESPRTQEGSGTMHSRL